MARKNGILIRRLPDEATGEMVTYLPLAQVCAVAGVSATSVVRWQEMQAIRSTDKLAGGKNYALVDVAKVRMLGRKGCAALGIKLTPDRYLKAQREWYAETQGETRKRAEYAGEEWDDYDIKFLLEELARGRTTEIIAKALGRTYAATQDMISHLRASGDIEPAGRAADEAWMVRVLPLLTIEEARLLNASS